MEVKCYARINGVDYFDWTLYSIDSSWYRKLDKDPARFIAIDTETLRKFEDLDASLLDETFVPPLNSEVHIVPSCPVGMADIRKNYTVKRKPDDGCCNVFSPYKGCYGHFWNTDYAIIPSKRAIVLGHKNQWNKSLKNSKEIIQELFPELLPTDYTVVNKEQNICYAELSDDWLMLLTKQLKKPCVSYQKLEFKSDNEVTLDILDLVFRTGSQQWSQDNQKAFHIQLCALNEHNWRDYKGTIGMIFHDVLCPFGRCRSNSIASDLRCLSRIPKAAKELVDSCMKQEGFVSKEDLELAQEFMRNFLGMNGVKFTTMETVISKCGEHGINMQVLFGLFDNMVKLEPKQFGNTN